MLNKNDKWRKKVIRISNVNDIEYATGYLTRVYEGKKAGFYKKILVG